MPPLNSPRRMRRRLGEIVALAGLAGALWGPVGSAEAGVSAGSAANARFSPSPGKAVTLGSQLGTGPGAKDLGILKGPLAERFAGCDAGTFTTSFYTKLAPTWTGLYARSKPCTSATPTGTWGSNQTMYVSRYTAGGQFICRGGTYGYGTAYWYLTSKGWVWAGGTVDPAWDYSRNC